MSTTPTAFANAWEDRWNPPTVEALLAEQKEQHQHLLKHLLEQFGEFEGVETSVIWYGTAWKWTVQFTLNHPDAGEVPDPMAYFVPDPESPVMCIPLREEQIDQLPLKRLNRYIRDSIRSAKCAVSVHWCKWNPTAMTEVEHLLDLFKRKHKMLTGKATRRKAG